ncbi:MAG: nuclear transport factor 2 family protein [Alphaproteobacteria bacterium]|nr:nuclear transport factor 2 family protein [Alphaproteobacteria bacterium]
MRTAEAILDNHLSAFARGDLEGILSDYAPDAIFFTPSGLLEGVAQIRPLFQKLIEEFAKPGARFELAHRSTTRDHAYIIWSAETADNVYEFVTDTISVKGGRIAMQSFAATIRPKS